MVQGSLLTTIAEARAFVEMQPAVYHGTTVHWLDQGSSRLAERASIRQLQRMWHEAQDEAVQLDAPGIDPVDREAARLFRLALAMAIVAKGEPPIRLPVDP
jgi:hypothetical protein